MIPGEFTGKAVHSTQKNIGLQFQFTE
jgi:hypothetical protein